MNASSLLHFSFLLLTSFVLGCATTADQYDIRPDAADDGIPTAVIWQNRNDRALKEATKPETLAKFVETDAAADALLAQLKGAYGTDPMTMTQIGCVTQLVMCPKCPKAPACRKVWVAALERARAKTDDGYVRTFCDQQLRLCK